MAEGVNMGTAMTIESGAMTEAAVVERRRVAVRSGGPFVRWVARAPISVRAKHLVGFGVIVVLLVVVAAAGLLALRQSNSRVVKLRTEQQKATLVQAIRADAGIVQSLVNSRKTLTVPPGTKGVTPEPSAYYGSLDGTISQALGAFGADLTAGERYGNGAQGPNSGYHRPYFERFYPALYKTIQQKLTTFSYAGTNLGLIDETGRGAWATHLVHREWSVANWLVAALEPIAQQASSRTNQLVAANSRSFASSRDLVIGVTAGSIALALALGLLISASLLVPLRRTDTRMAEIASGDFTGQLEVPNRDEIGRLAANVNRMSDELGRLYQELETASRHKSDFLATMSHELRTPLNSIIGFSEVLREQMFGELNERQLAYVDDVLDAGKHLLSLINDVLDLAKVEAGRMELELSEVALPELLESAISMHSEQASRGDIELSLNSEPNEITVPADERRLRQVVFNLLSNAIKFTPPGGHVDVSARLANGQVAIAIADTGPGISAAELETIFEEFEQTTHGKRADGTGLGLPLSRKLVELHGGRLWAESAAGRGSTFRFTLPTRQEVP
jgi:signal transduction histidine kinase